MDTLRADIAAAANRMRVVFGARSAMKHLVHSLETGENVREMVACLFAGADGLLVLSDRRVLALRDDYSKYSMKDATLDEITLIDYGPRVHDGLAVFTDTARVAVRKMNREDADRFVDLLTQQLPAVPVVISKPAAPASTNARLVTKAPLSKLAVPPRLPAPTAPAQALPTVAQAPMPAVIFDPIPAPGIPSLEATAPDPTIGEVAADKEVLYGVLADLHGRGLLSAEELAVKVAEVAATT